MGIMACIAFAVYRRLGPVAATPVPAETRGQCGPMVTKAAPCAAPDK
jgi:hypothetical protein